MIRMNFVARRLPGLSREEFQEYWRYTHGPLVARHQRALRIRRYVQSHTLDDALGEAMRQQRTGMEDPYDGVASLWWDNRDEIAEAFATPEGQAAGQELLEDEQRFADLSRSALWLSMEVPQINPMPENSVMARRESAIIKGVYVVNALPSLTREACQRYWLMHHGALARSYGAAMGFLRYIQSHTIDEPLNDIFRESRGAMVPYDGLTEVWFDRMELTQILSAPDGEGFKGFGLLLEDEKTFVDFSRSSVWFAKEHVVIDW
jgi:uncharacterized protein (TIGR02118 family)